MLRHNALLKLEIGLCGLPEQSEIAIAESCKKRQLELEGIPYDMYLAAKEARLNATTTQAKTLTEEGEEGEAEGDVKDFCQEDENDDEEDDDEGNEGEDE